MSAKKPMEKIETPVNRLRRILNESGTISDIDWQEAIEAEQIEMMTAVDLFVNYRRFTEDAFKTWYAENYQENSPFRQPPVSGELNCEHDWAVDYYDHFGLPASAFCDKCNTRQSI